MPYTNKSLWQYVLYEPTDELLNAQLHLRVLLLSIIFIAEMYLAIFDGLDPMVANGHLVRISPQVFYDTCGPCKRSLGIDHPRFFK